MIFPTRRSFLKQAGALAAMATVTRRGLSQTPLHAQMRMKRNPAAPDKPLTNGRQLEPFVDPMPLPAVAKPTTPGHYRIAMREVMTKVHRDVPATRVWTYCQDGDTSGIAPLLEARKGEPVQVEWLNQLPKKHFLPIDYTLHGCGHDVPQVRAVVHLHGACVPTKDDGYPEDWYPVGGSRVCHYPNKNDATMLWFHDHAMGINRLNVYAGLYGAYVIRDEQEDALPLPRGQYEVPLLLADRLLYKDGGLYYPKSPDAAKPWNPETLGDALLVNGKVKPYFEVEPRRYRLRLLNASNAKFLNLDFEDKRKFHLIGCDQGLLAAPVTLSRMTVAPSERMDVIVDFSDARGKKVVLRSAFEGVLQFRVKDVAVHDESAIPAVLREVKRMPASDATVTRTITLHEYQDDFGNSQVMLLNRKHWHEPVAERPKLGATEIWEFVNLTGDVHPMHMHMVRFQILDRQQVSLEDYVAHNKRVDIGGPVKPGAFESGWKDTVQCYPEMLTRVIVTFDGYRGKFLYHCHVLEHEANDMMRPFEVV